MFRGPNSGDGAHSSDYSQVIPLFGSAGAGTEVLDHEVDPRDYGAPSGRAWSGGGGRWLLWPLRAVLWAALLIVAYRGVTAIVFHQASDPAAGGTEPAGVTAGQFPVSLAEAYATEFGQVYLNFSPAIQAQREQELAAFVPPSVAAAHPDLGLERHRPAEPAVRAGRRDRGPGSAARRGHPAGHGQRPAHGARRAGDRLGRRHGGRRGARLAARADSRSRRRQAASQGSDPVARSQLMNELPAFFQAYATGDSAALSRFELRGVPLTGLGGAVTFGSIAGLQVPPGGTTRQITVTVIWQVPAGLRRASQN